ncbi:thermostable hemolysin [Massilia sp. YIM B02769]|uniref:thermostable hemolysin n=1 Tax=Massilia sp. YIM B02769 TaxID=3050129 RepID=UPI0025B63E89|nr:thermostable hemolysin [Massilia sp. YIM B02769]MDN4061259.1 thermostable hemolysin [Massilia sp. YIM B02769]
MKLLESNKGEGSVLPIPREPRGVSFERFERGDVGRAAVEAFIAATFLENYDARITHFNDTLVGSRGPDGNWIAALGFSLAGAHPLFLEHYLDAPVEAEIGARLGHPVAREGVVEVGNLAALHPGAARALIVGTTTMLHELGLSYVTFTATTSLFNSFGRLQLRPQVLALADPARLSFDGGQWGTYYDTHPQVMFGDIQYGYSKLARLAARLRRPAE